MARMHACKRRIRLASYLCAFSFAFLALESVKAQEPPKKIALVIGVSEHRMSMPLPRLKYTAADTDAIAREFERLGYEVVTCRDAFATREKVLRELNRIKNLLNSDDSFVFYWEGFSVRDPFNHTYFLTYDAELTEPSVNGLGTSELIDQLRDIKTPQKLVLLDTFFGGDVLTASPDSTQRGTRNNGSSVTATTAKVAPQTIVRNVVPEESYRKDFSKSFEGVIVVSAHHDSAERDDLRHGIFAAALLRVLGSPAGDLNKDGLLTVGELAKFLQVEVRRLTSAAAGTMSFASGDRPDWTIGAIVRQDRSPKDSVDLYATKLKEWRKKALISDMTYFAAQGILARWLSSTEPGEQLSETESRLVEDLAWHLDLPGSEAANATSLQRAFEKRSQPAEVTNSQQTAKDRGAVLIRESATEEEKILYEGSYALLIGVTNYARGWKTLPGVQGDLKAVKSLLEGLGFKVLVVQDPTKDEFNTAMENFIADYGQTFNHRLLVYFAGHGYTEKSTFGTEMGYIVTRDASAPTTDRAHFRRKAIDMITIEGFALRMQSKHVLFLFDSCFAGTIFSLPRSAPHNIEYKTTYPVREFITSGSADETVPDRSIFRDVLVRALSGDADVNPQDGYVTGSELGEFVQEKVSSYSAGTQHPQYGKIRVPNLDKGDFVFALNPPR